MKSPLHWLCFLGGDRLNDAKDSFKIGGLGFALLTIWRKHFNRGTNCPPLGFQFRVTSKHLLMSIICLKRKPKNELTNKESHPQSDGTPNKISLYMILVCSFSMQSCHLTRCIAALPVRSTLPAAPLPYPCAALYTLLYALHFARCLQGLWILL